MPAPTMTGILITAISALSGVIVWLALYIRRLHNRSLHMQVENTKQMLGMTERVVEVVTKVNATIAINTETIERTAHMTNKTMGSLQGTVNDLHKYLLSALK